MAFKYTATFHAIARIIDPTEQDRFVAKASLASLRGILPPDVNPEESPDLLYISCNGAVGGLINKNDDGITNETALLINNSAKNKYITTDHDRSKPVGVVLYPGFSSFITNEPLTFEQASALKEPVNMAFAGVLWKTINPMLSKYIRNNVNESADSLSMSWEIGFESYSIGVGHKNLFDAEIIKPGDPKFAAYDRYLRANRGDGKDPSGQSVFRVINDDSAILGYSIVANPAAEVKGILPVESIKKNDTESVPVEKDKASTSSQIPESQHTAIEESVEDSEIVSVTICDKNEEKNITLTNASVIPNTAITMTKITTLSEFESAVSKHEAAAALVDFVKAIQKGSDEYVAKVEATENAAKTNEARAKELEAALAKIQAELTEVKAQAEATEATQKFQERMAAFDETFDLDAEDVKLIASDITSLDDTSFAAYMAKCKKLMASKTKAAKKGVEDDSAFSAKKKKVENDDSEDDDGDESDKDGKKSDKDKASKASDKTKDMIKEALASLIADKNQAITHEPVKVDASIVDEMAEAFGPSVKIDGKPVQKKK